MSPVLLRQALRLLPHRAFPRTVPVLAFLVTTLAGCSVTTMPTQANPSCSWEQRVPNNSDAICRQTFRTIRALVRAQTTGDDRAIARLVDSRRVARHIIDFGRAVRSQRVGKYEAVPSIVIDLPGSGVIGANFQLAGIKPNGDKFKASESIYFHLRHGTAYVFTDQPEEAW